MSPTDAALLRCPLCRQALTPDLSRCTGCGERWPVIDGLPALYRESEVRGNDRLLRLFYDGLPRLHDPAVRWILPLLQWGSEDSLRDGYFRRIDLASLRPRIDGRPVRILEVGIGAGANLSRVWRDLPPGLEAEIWGLDLSRGMLAQCERRIAREGWSGIRLLLADAHRLPFADATFDRVFHVGGIGGFRDPRLALAEMGRVAVPGTPIVVVDEQLDPGMAHTVYHRLMFRLLTFYDSDPHCPAELLPPGSRDVVQEAVSRFYYCLTFRVGGEMERGIAAGTDRT